jgi:mannosylfructose-phosphate synthase
MVTNHGVHEWQVNAGLPDTGGQNVYVAELSGAFAKLGFRVTTANRGGYAHPVDSGNRRGERYRGEAERIMYIEDSKREFVRKEDMFSHTEELGHDLARRIGSEGSDPILIVSHYWDGAEVAEVARAELGVTDVPHVWIPHSLGKLKKQNTDRSEWDDLRIPERIAAEEKLLRQVDRVAHTSATMRSSLRDDYGYRDSLFLPPGVDTDRFDPNSVKRDQSALDLLSSLLPKSREAIARAPLITEISRTVATKRKDVLLKSFADLRRNVPEALLAVAIDSNHQELYADLTALIDDLSLSDSVAVLGSVWEYVPSLYGMTSVYCTPSVMEGFGMSIQEAAACGVPAVSSTLVPFAVEYLLGEDPRSESFDGETMWIGEGAIVVPPDRVDGFARALIRLLEDEPLRARLGRRAYDITVPAFSWQGAAEDLLQRLGLEIPTRRPLEERPAEERP